MKKKKHQNYFLTKKHSRKKNQNFETIVVRIRPDHTIGWVQPLTISHFGSTSIRSTVITTRSIVITTISLSNLTMLDHHTFTTLFQTTYTLTPFISYVPSFPSLLIKIPFLQLISLSLSLSLSLKLFLCSSLLGCLSISLH